MSQRTYLGIMLRWATDTLPAASVLILSSSAFDSVAVRTTCLGLMSSRANGRPDPNIRTSTSSRPDAISLLPSNKKSSLQQSYSTRLFHFNNMHAQQFMYSFMRLGILEGWGGGMRPSNNVENLKLPKLIKLKNWQTCKSIIFSKKYYKKCSTKKLYKSFCYNWALRHCQYSWKHYSSCSFETSRNDTA